MVGEKDKYYKLIYKITYNTGKTDKTESQNLEVLVDQNSKIFDYQF